MNHVYWEYVVDLGDDVNDITRYFWKDFLLKPGKRRTPNLSFGDSLGARMLPVHVTY